MGHQKNPQGHIMASQSLAHGFGIRNNFSQDTLGCHKEEGCWWHLMSRARDAAKCPSIHSTFLPNQEFTKLRMSIG